LELEPLDEFGQALGQEAEDAVDFGRQSRIEARSPAPPTKR
jgi:hypothetical protein